MQRKKVSYFEMLVMTALACVHHRRMLELYKDDDNSHYPDRAADEAMSALLTLAAASKAEGRDARTSPLYESFGPMAVHYEEAYEQWRPVECQELTPRVIFDAMDKGNKLIWGDWVIKASRGQEVTDDYGLPAWDRIVTVTHSNGSCKTLEYSNRPRHRALEIYRVVTGTTFDGDDGLPRDPRHMYDGDMDDDWP
ncbi:hypothetical protein [Pseudomonas serbica]|uniref:hypothetical protein n=1 Tax=Pseudomonas serbica TaxID=2965074 RepID=UPI00237A18C4|nr:hypothetical protein [Pseudomonas serbica]